MSDMGMISMIRIIRVLFLYVLIAHWGGCMWYSLNKWESRQTTDEVSWMINELNNDKFIHDSFGGPFQRLGCVELDIKEGSGDVPIFDNSTAIGQTCQVGELSQYWIVMYAAMMLMMGDNIDPQTSIERAYAVTLTLLGACLTAMMFGQMTQIVSGMDTESRKQDELMQHVKDQMKSMKVVGETQDRVHDYFDYQ